MNIDNRTFKYAGSSADSNGVYKARFANDPDARPAVMTKAGHKDFVLIALPTPMTKLDAIAYLKEVQPEGVNLASLDAKASYINRQVARLNGTAVPTKRGRPATKNVVKSTATSTTVNSNTIETPAPESLVKTIVNTARGGSIRAKAAQQAAKVIAAKK
jgi:hypothetical protein